jgi:Ca2+-binding EF-hand superfamily protein
MSDYDESRFERSPSNELPSLVNERIEKLLKSVHQRIEEKYRDFRQAFRAIDKDFGGNLDFKEFMTALEEIGIKLRIGDFKLVFDAIDYDGKGFIDFEKFCFLNADRYTYLDLLRMVISLF